MQSEPMHDFAGPNAGTRLQDDKKLVRYSQHIEFCESC
jgi:hypothetical protein